MFGASVLLRHILHNCTARRLKSALPNIPWHLYFSISTLRSGVLSHGRLILRTPVELFDRLLCFCFAHLHLLGVISTLGFKVPCSSLASYRLPPYVSPVPHFPLLGGYIICSLYIIIRVCASAGREKGRVCAHQDGMERKWEIIKINDCLLFGPYICAPFLFIMSRERGGGGSWFLSFGVAVYGASDGTNGGMLLFSV